MPLWLTNVIGLGLLFWEMDRGGPVARHTRFRERLSSDRTATDSMCALEVSLRFL